jgi:hypothetical protein
VRYQVYYKYNKSDTTIEKSNLFDDLQMAQSYAETLSEVMGWIARVYQVDESGNLSKIK